MDKQTYKQYLSPDELEQIDRVCGLDWAIEDIPAYMKNNIKEITKQEIVEDKIRDEIQDNLSN